MKKIFLSLLIMICIVNPARADYDPQHTMLALNMAIVSVHNILTTQSRVVLEDEFSAYPPYWFFKRRLV